jgi:protein-tyrosine phosphatase
MSSFKSNLIEAYGLKQIIGLDANVDSDENIVTKEHLRVAFFNLSMTIKDGIPIQLPGFDYLFLGSIGSAYNLKSLQKCGITHILCLSGVIKTQFEDNFEYLRISMKDQPDYDVTESLEQCFEFITSAQMHRTENGENGRVLVHCYQGKSRSVAICCAYMMKMSQIRFSEALAAIRTVRPIAAPNSGFERILRGFENKDSLNEHLGEIKTECVILHEDSVVNVDKQPQLLSGFI